MAALTVPAALPVLSVYRASEDYRWVAGNRRHRANRNLVWDDIMFASNDES
jgi:hypothetical protein